MNRENIIVVSDFHICEGKDPATGFYSSREDFFYDNEFAGLLEYYDHKSKGNNNLIINGDFFDFQQINLLPSLMELDEFNLSIPANYIKRKYLTKLNSKKPSIYYNDLQPLHMKEFPLDFFTEEAKAEGLGATKEEFLFKVSKAVEGHSKFFHAIVEFILKGNRVTIIKGNHDVELYWLLYEDIMDKFVALCIDAWENYKTPETPNHHSQENTTDEKSEVKKKIKAGLKFYNHFYYEKGRCYIEHGNQYEATTALRHPYYTELPIEENGNKINSLELDYSSFIVRYLINRVESINPLSDNLRPKSEYFMWVIKEHTSDFFKVIKKTFFPLLKILGNTLKRSPELSKKDKERKNEAASLCGIDERIVDGINSLYERPTLTYTFFRAMLSLHLPQIFSFIIAGLLLIILIAGKLIFLFTGYSPPDFISVIIEIILYCTFGFAALGLVFVIIYGIISKKRECYKNDAQNLTEEIRERMIKSEDPSPPFREKAKCIYEVFTRHNAGVKFIIFGHTHRPDRQKMDEEGTEYLNPGTWIAIFNREEELIRSPHTLSFIQITGDKARILNWDKNIGKPEELILQKIY